MAGLDIVVDVLVVNVALVGLRVDVVGAVGLREGDPVAESVDGEPEQLTAVQTTATITAAKGRWPLDPLHDRPGVFCCSLILPVIRSATN